jgi:hypothetical protein
LRPRLIFFYKKKLVAYAPCPWAGGEGSDLFCLYTNKISLRLATQGKRGGSGFKYKKKKQGLAAATNFFFNFILFCVAVLIFIG